METISILLLAALLVALYFLLRFNRSYNKNLEWSSQLWEKNQILIRKNEVLQIINNLQIIYYKTRSKDQLFVEIRVLSQDAADSSEVREIIKDYFVSIFETKIFVGDFLEIIKNLCKVDTFNSRRFTAMVAIASALSETKNDVCGLAYANSIISGDEEVIAALKDILNYLDDNDSSYFLNQLKRASNFLDDYYIKNREGNSSLDHLSKILIALKKINLTIKLLEEDSVYVTD